MSADRNTAGEKTELGKGPGIRFPRYFTIADDDPYDLIEWDSRTALITNNTGEAVFEQRDVRTPTAWSQQAINIVASMYFRGKPDSPERESDIGRLIDRVVNRITSWGYAGWYFRSPEDRDAFRDELKHLIVHQKASFNSPVWFNCGHREKPQCSACFIIAVEDSMESILDLAKTEGMLFKHGSGTGSNLSALRSSGETLNGGGTASGPVSFMKGFDAFAGVIKSGGSCLTGSQPVYTTGGPVRAAELAEHENGFVCTSWDPPTGSFKTKHAHAWLSGVKTVLRVRTDGGEFDVSSDHPFRLADGETVTAENLRTDTMLHTYRGTTDEPQTPLRVTGVDPLGTMPVYSVEVDCPTADDKTAASGHTFVIWPDDRPDGAGVVVHNTRRAAKMVILNADHPDIVNFIECKAREEKKAWALIDAGYDSSITGDAYTSIFFQNANNSVRVTNAFMKAVADDDPWETLSVTGEQRVVKTYQARDLMRRIAEAAHVCGDPGMQFDTTVNEWHTCPRTDRIRASNPCFVGETEVLTSEGRIRIEKLAEMSAAGEELPLAITQDPEARTPVLRRIKTAWKSKTTSTLVEVRTDKGITIRCTPDHKFYLYDGRGIAASDLEPGQSLRKIGLHRYSRGRVGISGARGSEPLSRWLWSQHHGAIPEGHHIHHRNGIIKDDRLSNLESLPAREHWSEHSTGSRNVMFLGTPVETLLAIWKAIKAARPGWPVTVARWNLFVKRQGLKGQVPLSNPQRGIRGMKWAEFTSWIAEIRQEMPEVEPLQTDGSPYKTAVGASPEQLLDVWEALQKKNPVTWGRWNYHVKTRGLSGKIPQFNKSCWAAFAQRMEEGMSLANDRVKSVREITVKPVPVFDLEVEGIHRFAVSSDDALHGLVVSNCSEYMFLDDSACNLASINLMKFEDAEHGFDTEAFTAAVRTIITAQEIIVGNASYPTPAIERNSHDYRPLGLGYCNLGAFLMSQALPYDSDDGRAAAGAITALMTGAAYEQSAIIARDAGGPFHGFERNREPFLKVMKKHAGAVRLIESGSHKPSEGIAAAATQAWQAAIGIGSEHGFRNAQATVLAPTGTIGFMMDCDTTGVEPDIALVKYKKLVNQGLMKIVNQTVPKALKRLCYDEKTARAILEHIETGGTIENAPGFAEEDLDIFDCAFKPQNGERSIAPSGHIRMIGAVQPFISGAISKTINMPTDTTVDEIERTYIDAWKQGAKSVSIYRDGSKRSQPLTTGEDDENTDTEEHPKPSRRRLADERRSITHKFEVGGHEGYVTVGIYKDGTPGELFIVMAKEGSTISGFADAFAQAISYALQYGVPLEMLVNKFCHQRFEPAGMTRNPKIRMAKSIVDYIVRWMATKFLDEDAQRAIGINLPEKPTTNDGPAGAAPTGTPESAPGETAHPMAMNAAHLLPNDQDAPPCPACGSIMLRNGTCYACPNCGTTSGCS